VDVPPALLPGRRLGRREAPTYTPATVIERIVELLRPYLSAPWGYVIVSVGIFLENSIAVGLIIPGETLIILAGFYARQGVLSLPVLIVLVCVSAVLGDNTGYWIGRRFGRSFIERHGRKVRLTPARLSRADAYYERHGGKTVFLGRFVPVIRSVSCLIAGVSGMTWDRFLAYEIPSAVLVQTEHALLGYVLGAAYQRAGGYLRNVGLVGLVALFLLIGAGKLRKARETVEEELQEIHDELEEEGLA
jgi:membrane protein DedA with SNARE-associated domain